MPMNPVIVETVPMVEMMIKISVVSIETINNLFVQKVKMNLYVLQVPVVHSVLNGVVRRIDVYFLAIRHKPQVN